MFVEYGRAFVHASAKMMLELLLATKTVTVQQDYFAQRKRFLTSSTVGKPTVGTYERAIVALKDRRRNLWCGEVER